MSKRRYSRRVVLSVEQALTMTYATLRCVHLGYRVIKVEPTPVVGRKSRGDPNRYIGRPVAGEDIHSYFVGPNTGKESIAIDLKSEQGQELLKRLIKDLDVDIFCTNTIPMRHDVFGIDYETLKRVKEDLIWCSISAMGSKYPKVPGYDPVLQAMCGYMDLTGHPDGPPLQSGIPIIDLKAGDEAFTQILLALMERGETGKGKKIDISMAQVATSWLLTFLPMLDMDSPPSELKRSGNEHRQFIPVNAYRTKDGFIYMALGSDAQWARFIGTEMFSSLDDERYTSNEGRRANKKELHVSIEAITFLHLSNEVKDTLASAAIPNSPITPIEEVSSLDFAATTMLETRAPDGRIVRLPPPAVETDELERLGGKLPFAPSYGANTESLLKEVGLDVGEIDELKEQKVVA